MTRIQLRPFYTEQERARIYHRNYDHTWWPDHIERVDKTAQLLGEFAAQYQVGSVADLSCGDGAIIGRASYVFREIHLGDLVTPMLLDRTTEQWKPRPGDPDSIEDHYYSGPIEQTIGKIPPVDLFLCSETLEHVEDPDALLRFIRAKAKHLLLTTPCGENHARNPEHYWGWGRNDVGKMLWDAGWRTLECELWRPEYEHPDTYLFQMWRAS